MEAGMVNGQKKMNKSHWQQATLDSCATLSDLDSGLLV